MTKYIYNEETYEWERVDKVQYYKGIKIETIATHDNAHKVHHREYRVYWPDGKTSDWTINKRGGNIKNLKGYIDFRFRYGEIRL